MKIKYTKTAVVLGSVLALGAACSKKKSKSTETSTTSTTVLTPSEDTVVTVPTGQLQLASSITILPAKGANAALALNGKSSYKLTVDDRTLNLRVSNDAFRSIEQAGSIMCFFGQTKFWEQANEGVYKALIDESMCDKNSGGGGGGGGSGQGGDGGGESNKAQELMVMYTKATREENKPLIAEFRIQEGDATIHAKVIVVAPPSDDNPAGIFSMAYTFYGADGSTGQYGFIRTKRTESGAFLLETAGKESGGEHNSTGTSQGVAELTRDADTDDFTGYVRSDSNYSYEEGSSVEAYKVRFDANYLNASGGSTHTHDGRTHEQKVDGCFDRNKFKTGIYRYDLADASGNLVKLNSGFPAEFESDGKTYPANAGYHGLWTGEVQLATGATVYKVDWANGSKTRTPYTLFKAPGKLIKLTKATTTLGALKGVDLNFWDNGSSYIVKWDGTKLSKVAKVTYGDKGMTEEAASGDVVAPEWGLSLYVSSLNAQVQISNDVALSDSTVISYHSEATVSGTADVPAGQMVCFNNCPIMAPTAAAFQRSQGGMNGPMVSALYKSSSVTWGDQTYTANQVQDITTALGTYSFDSSALVLTEAGTPFALPSDLPTNEDDMRNLDQVFSGALIPIAAWQALADKNMDPYRAEQEVEVYYKWTAGASNWSQFQSLKDATGSFVSFDRPLEINYTLATADEFDGLTDSNVVGKSYRLNYGGPGQLWGIPWKYNASVGYEMPLFSLKDGTKAGNYTIIPREGDQRMAATDAANCSGLSLADLPELPVLENSSVDVGTFGDDNTPTKYIGGVSVN